MTGDFILSFGKYKNQSIRSVPRSYLYYLMNDGSGYLSEQEEIIVLGLLKDKHVALGKKNLIFPFGRHAGKRIDEVDPTYLEWWVQNVDRTEKLNKAISERLAFIS